MASKTALNARNLEALGAARLAELLMELSTGDGAAQRRLRLELAGAQGAGEVAREVRRRLGQVARARSFVDWHRRRGLVEDLETQRRAIVEKVAPEDPAEALDLLWRFLALAGPVHERCDDGDGLVGDLFRDALADLGDVAAAAPADPEGLADQAFDALQDNGYAQYDGLVAVLAPALGERGLAQLERRLKAWAALPAEGTAADGEAAEGSGSVADGMSERILRERRSAARLALMDIADARGDADGFVAQLDGKTRRAPAVAAAIAERLLAAGRAEEALAALDAAETSRRPSGTPRTSRRSTPWGGARRRRRRAGRASRRRCRRRTCARTSSACPTSRTSTPRSARWITSRATPTPSRRSASSSGGPRSTGPPPWRWPVRPSSTATPTGS